jgi:hypothetical protein
VGAPSLTGQALRRAVDTRAHLAASHAEQQGHAGNLYVAQERNAVMLEAH